MAGPSGHYDQAPSDTRPHHCLNQRANCVIRSGLSRPRLQHLLEPRKSTRHLNVHYCSPAPDNTQSCCPYCASVTHFLSLVGMNHLPDKLLQPAGPEDTREHQNGQSTLQQGTSHNMRSQIFPGDLLRSQCHRRSQFVCLPVGKAAKRLRGFTDRHCVSRVVLFGTLEAWAWT